MRSRFLYLITGVFLAGCGASPPPAAIRTDVQSATVELRNTIEKMRVAQKIPGLTVAFSTPEIDLWTEGFGQSDIENAVLAKPETVYRLASVSKTLTATRALQLAEQGKLLLDNDVREYCSEFPEKPQKITTKQLIGHLGGIRNYRPDEWGEGVSKVFYPNITSALAIFKNDPLISVPGTEFQYTTYGYTLVGCAIEGADDVPFMQQMKTHVFLPAGMTATRQDSSQEVIPNRANGYRLFGNGTLQNARLADTSNKVPGGGMAGTARDLVRFGQAFLDDRLLSTAWRRIALTSLKTNSGQDIWYGMGWGLGKYRGSFVASHTGGQEGTSSVLWVMPDRKLIVAVLTNLQDVKMMPFAEAVHDVLSVRR